MATSSQVTMGVTQAPGLVTVTTPLPGLPGVQSVSFPPATTVGEFLGKLRALDPSIGEASAEGADRGSAGVLSLSSGLPLAHSTPMWAVVREGWVLRAASLEVVAPAAGGASLSERIPQPQLDAAYAKVTQALLDMPGRTTSFQAFLSLCRKAVSDVAPAEPGAADAIFNHNELLELCERWKVSLHQEGVILHFDAAKDNKLRETLFLQPASQALTGDLTLGLDIDGAALAEEIVRTRGELEALEDELAAALDTQEPLDRAAERYVNRLANLGGLGMVAQFAGLAALVYEVSWDVMEPAIYFLGLGYSVVFYAFFLRYRRDPEFDNIFGQLLAWRRAKLYARADFDPEVIAVLEESIERKKGDISLLQHRLGAEA